MTLENPTPADNSAEAGIIKQEPVVASYVTSAVLAAVGGFAVTHGWIGQTQDSTLVQTATPIVAAAVLVVIGFVVRKFVVPVVKLIGK